MKMTKDELDQLGALNRQRDPLQEKLAEEAGRLFEIWNQLNPTGHGWRQFKAADLLDQEIRIQFQTGCSCSGPGEDGDISLPIEALLDSKWEAEARQTIAARTEEERRRQRAEAERQERDQLAALKSKYE